MYSQVKERRMSPQNVSLQNSNCFEVKKFKQHMLNGVKAKVGGLGLCGRGQMRGMVDICNSVSSRKKKECSHSPSSLFDSRK